MSAERSILRHITTSTFLVHLLLISTFVTAAAYLAKVQLKKEFIQSSENYGAALSKRIAEQWDNSDQISDILLNEVTSGTTNYIYIGTKTGKILFKSGRSTSSNNLQKNDLLNPSNTDTFNTSFPLKTRLSTTPLRLYIGFNKTANRQKINYIHQRLIYFAIIYLLLTVITSLKLVKTISSPLKEIRAFLQRAAQGSYDEIYTNSPIKELKELAQELNSLHKDMYSKTKKLKHQATHDMLTGLPNRALCLDRINQAMALSQRKRQTFSLMLLDLDQFKEINDTLGHKAGDLLLEVTASRLMRIVRKSDSVARLGGDEFAILLPSADASQTAIVAQKALKSIQKPFHFEDHTLHIHASIGAAIYPDHGRTVGDLLHNADVAMYHAKRGRLGYTIHHSKLITNDTGTLTLTSDLEEAIEQDEIILYFQPKLDIKTNNITGVEALIRWQHHKRGLIYPDDFIPVAENSGIIDKLTLYTISKAIQQCVKWLREGFQLTIAVNISARNLLDPHFSSAVFALLERHQLPAKYLEIELTESAVMTDPDLAKDTLRKFNHKGISISLDDFGAGNTSLSHFLDLPLQIIKIDRSFIEKLANNTHRQSIVHRIIDMAHALDLYTVIEGVEDEQGLHLIEQLGGDAVQGYVLTKPLLSENFILWLKQQTGWSYPRS